MPRWIRAALIPAVLFSITGCDEGGFSSRIDTAFALPSPRLPRLQLSDAERMLAYPDVSHTGRDPFLTKDEQDAIDNPPVVVKVETPKDPGGLKPWIPKRPVEVKNFIERLHATVTGIITGPRNMFFFEDKPYIEGDVLPYGWIVQWIRPEGIRIVTADGKDFDELKLVRDAPTTPIFEHSGQPAAP